ncbi:MAG: NAD(P)-dependent oxidoreductase [Verrucomicrobiota bacterium]
MPESLPKVLCTVPIPLEQLSALKGLAEVVLPAPGPSAADRSTVFGLISDCVAVISQGELRVDEELLDAAPCLRFVANAAMGIDNLDLVALRNRGIQSSNTPDAFAESTADLAMGLLLSLLRRIAETDRYVRTGSWAQGMEALRWEGTHLAGKTLGLIGYGRIAKLVEKRAQAFEMRVIHTRSSPSDNPKARSLELLLTESDAVLTLVPLTEQTHHLIDADRLSQMKPGAVFINVARGKVMDERAVVAALQSGHLAGAAFDVFENEPKVQSALFEMDNVVLTPHVGGATREQRERGRREAAEAVAKFLRRESVESLT